MAFFYEPNSLAHLTDKAKLLREEAELLPPGDLRDATICAARQATIALHLDKWVNSPGLLAPT